MQRLWSRRRVRAGAGCVSRLGIAVAGALTLAACNHDGQPSASLGQSRGPTVAFESIDGPPPRQFQTLVRNLNEEAQNRRLAVLSRENASVYRVRGYLAARVSKDETIVSWVWDVFDRDEQRTLRIAGEENAKSRPRDAWSAADDAMMQRIARTSMDQLAAFLNATGAPPAVPAAEESTAVAALSLRDSSPEAAGIYRIFQAHADPASTADAGPVPLPRRRPGEQVSARETLTLAASPRH